MAKEKSKSYSEAELIDTFQLTRIVQMELATESMKEWLRNC